MLQVISYAIDLLRGAAFSLVFALSHDSVAHGTKDACSANTGMAADSIQQHLIVFSMVSPNMASTALPSTNARPHGI